MIFEIYFKQNVMFVCIVINIQVWRGEVIQQSKYYSNVKVSPLSGCMDNSTRFTSILHRIRYEKVVAVKVHI